MKPTLSVYIIARDEEMYIGKALKSVQNIADELIVVTDINIDRTIDIAKSFGAQVILLPKSFDMLKQGWGNYENFAINCCSKDWVLKLDADEELVTPRTVLEAITDSKSSVFRGFREEWAYAGHPSQYSWNPGVILNKVKEEPIQRLWRNNGKASYKGFIHPAFLFSGVASDSWKRVNYRIKHYSFCKPYGLRIRKSRLYSANFWNLWNNKSLRNGTSSGWFNNYVSKNLETIKRRAKDYQKFYIDEIPIEESDVASKQALDTIRLFIQGRTLVYGESKSIKLVVQSNLTDVDFLPQDRNKFDTIIYTNKNRASEQDYTKLNRNGIVIFLNMPEDIKELEKLFVPISTAKPFVFIKRK